MTKLIMKNLVGRSLTKFFIKIIIVEVDNENRIGPQKLQLL
jgi:hypothetical protein